MTTPQLEVRTAVLDEADVDRREISGIAVPWDTPATIGDYSEKFERGAIGDPTNVRLLWQHKEVIGRVVDYEDRDEGFHITARISQTPRGDEALTLIRDGAVSQFSVGFMPGEHRMDDNVLVRTRVELREVSAVTFPAYESAGITQVREARTEGETPMSDDTLTRADLDEVRSSIEDIERELKLVGSPTTTEPEGNQFRSFGEYVKAVASGDEAALRAYAGATTGDTVIKDGWVGDVIRLGQERQRITKLFRHTFDLPAEGNNIEYGVLSSDTTQVGVQPGEGEDLAYGKLAIDTRTAPVRTLGGWTDLSRQAIERTTVGVLDFTFRAMYLKYARAIETLTRGALTTAFNDATATALQEVEGDLTTQDGVVATLVELVEHFEDNASNLSGLLVSKDAFLSLLEVPSTDRILRVNQAPDDRLGTLTVSSLTGNIASVPVTLWPNAPTGAVLAYDEEAVRTQEAPGAPMRLQDENIVNLTKQFSVYGYAASYVQIPAGLTKVVTGA